MKVNDLNNLWVGYNETENFRVLVCAADIEEAQKLADEYCLNSHKENGFEITAFSRTDMQFDCDYVLTNCSYFKSKCEEKTQLKEEINVKNLIKRFRDMAERESLLARGDVTQQDLLIQIIGTIAVEAMEE